MLLALLKEEAKKLTELNEAELRHQFRQTDGANSENLSWVGRVRARLSRQSQHQITKTKLFPSTSLITLYLVNESKQRSPKEVIEFRFFPRHEGSLVPAPSLKDRFKGLFSTSTEFEKLRENILLQLVQALKIAHSKDIIHRDLKPANILIDDFAKLMLIDWGVSAYVGSYPAGCDPNDIVKGALARQKLTGNLQYMGPSQMDLNPAKEIDDVDPLRKISWELRQGKLIGDIRADSNLLFIRNSDLVDDKQLHEGQTVYLTFRDIRAAYYHPTLMTRPEQLVAMAEFSRTPKTVEQWWDLRQSMKEIEKQKTPETQLEKEKEALYKYGRAILEMDAKTTDSERTFGSKAIYEILSSMAAIESFGVVGQGFGFSDKEMTQLADDAIKMQLRFGNASSTIANRSGPHPFLLYEEFFGRLRTIENDGSIPRNQKLSAEVYGQTAGLYFYNKEQKDNK